MAPQPESARPQTDSTASACPSNTPAVDMPDAWTFQCADCGASWSVTTDSLIQGDDWIHCPKCRPAHHTPPNPSSPKN